MNYDSLKDTRKHIEKVNDYIGKCIIELDERGINHDSDKINDEVEKTLIISYETRMNFAHYVFENDSVSERHGVS
jgi:hypothetical protein